MEIAEIQAVFSKFYPGLKLEFYKKPHKDMEGSPKDEMVNNHLRAIELSPNIKMGALDIDKDQTVKSVEEQFERDFKLHAQVFRKANTIWLQTSNTDNWTLGKQNEKGLETN